LMWLYFLELNLTEPFSTEKEILSSYHPSAECL